MIYEYRTKGKHGFDGKVVPADTVVATVTTDRPLDSIQPDMITTDYPLDNILAGIRMSQFTVTKVEPVKPEEPKPIPPPPEPSPNVMKTKGFKPFKGKRTK